MESRPRRAPIFPRAARDEGKQEFNNGQGGQSQRTGEGVPAGPRREVRNRGQNGDRSARSPSEETARRVDPSCSTRGTRCVGTLPSWQNCVRCSSVFDGVQYEIFFNEDESEAVVFERYRDADAALEHFPTSAI
jgi:hypothetical protein